jgi:transporter family-2 protein
MSLVFVILAVAAGCLVPLQAGINASLRLSLNNPLLAAITNFLVGLTILLGFAAATRTGLPTAVQISNVPWWCWIGGSMGATLVLSGVFLSHRLGAATFIAAIILGQLAASVLLDHFGLVGYQQITIGAQRLFGLSLLVAGVYFIHRS